METLLVMSGLFSVPQFSKRSIYYFFFFQVERGDYSVIQKFSRTPSLVRFSLSLRSPYRVTEHFQSVHLCYSGPGILACLQWPWRMRLEEQGLWVSWNTPRVFQDTLEPPGHPTSLPGHTVSLPEYPVSLPEPMVIVCLQGAAAKLFPLASCHSKATRKHITSRVSQST